MITLSIGWARTVLKCLKKLCLTSYLFWSKEMLSFFRKPRLTASFPDSKTLPFDSLSNLVKPLAPSSTEFPMIQSADNASTNREVKEFIISSLHTVSSPRVLQCARLSSVHPAVDINQMIISHRESSTIC